MDNNGILTCQYPYLYASLNRCCMCRGKTPGCGCTELDAVNHFVQCHIALPCERGHLTVARMIELELPAPTEPCRNCGAVVSLLIGDDQDGEPSDDPTPGLLPTLPALSGNEEQGILP